VAVCNVGRTARACPTRLHLWHSPSQGGTRWTPGHGGGPSHQLIPGEVNLPPGTVHCAIKQTETAEETKKKASAVIIESLVERILVAEIYVILRARKQCGCSSLEFVSI
jgi:phosphoenolpyruvate carboxylase